MEGGKSCTQSPQHIRSVNRCYNAKYQFIIGNSRIFAEIKETKCVTTMITWDTGNCSSLQVLFLDFKTGYNNKSNKISLQFTKGEWNLHPIRFSKHRCAAPITYGPRRIKRQLELLNCNYKMDHFRFPNTSISSWTASFPWTTQFCIWIHPDQESESLKEK